MQQVIAHVVGQGLRPDLALAIVVGWRDAPIAQEDEELVSPDFDLPLEDRSRRMFGGASEEAVDPTLGFLRIALEGAVLEAVAPSPDLKGRAQMIAQLGGEVRIATVDGPLDVAQDMGEADLMRRRQSNGPRSRPQAGGRRRSPSPQPWPGADEADGSPP